MKFNMPMAVFGGLALIAAAIYFGSGSQPVNAAGGVQKIAICNYSGVWCANILHMDAGGAGAKYMAVVPFDGSPVDVDFNAVN